MKYLIWLLSLLVFSPTVWAQQTPAPPQSRAIAIVGATAHLGNGEVIENSFIAFEDGKLTIVADGRLVKPDRNKNYQIIQATGKHAYPGLIAPNSQLGLIEIGAVSATRDADEVGLLNPNVRSIIAYNTDSRVTPTVRSNGVLLAQIVPQGGRISGSSSVVELDAWNWEDAAYRTDDGIHLNWPRAMTWTGWRTGSPYMKKNEKYTEQVKEIKAFLKEAKVYMDLASVEEKNLKFEAMQGLFDQSKTLFVHTNASKTIASAVLMAKEFGLKLVIVGGADSWLQTDLLRENNVAVILRPTQRLPGREDTDIDQPFKTPSLLQQERVLFAFGGGGSWQQRNLPFQAGQAVGFGLDYEKAIAALTLNTAKILGIDKTVGSLEVGKDATLIVSEGDVLDMQTCKVEHAFIRGKAIDLDNKQKALYRKYKQKYSR
ncbi:MAG: amidohydrolase family protein [Bacteroidota bacterium]